MADRTVEEIESDITALEDDIACAEHDEDEDGDTSSDLDDMRCRLSDLRDELMSAMKGGE